MRDARCGGVAAGDVLVLVARLGPPVPQGVWSGHIEPTGRRKGVGSLFGGRLRIGYFSGVGGPRASRSTGNPRQHERRDLNPQPTVLETVALPLSYARSVVFGVPRFVPDGTPRRSRRVSAKTRNTKHETLSGQTKIFVTTPEPTVLPPSRIANRRPSSMATGIPSISSTVIFTLSPGMHISTPSGRVIEPVTSVVRK